MRFIILRLLTHSELGMFHEYRRQGKEGSKQRAINFDGEIVDRIFPAVKDSEKIRLELNYETDSGIRKATQWLKRQDKNWRLEGNCPEDKLYSFVTAGCLFAMEIEAREQPARGAWAVFPADHEVTKRILSAAESGGLTNSSMIALHESEAERIAALLAKSRPDLFKPILKAIGVAATNKSSAGVELAPNPSRLVKILAAVGHTLPSAVADLVDNAITADASEIEINFGRPDAGHGRWMTIADNGRGMSAANLAEAMRIGSNSKYETNSLGKYGYGLKGASWSQAKVFTVVTKQAGAETSHLSWDIDDMDGWIAKPAQLLPWEEDAVAIGSHGTVVLWKEMLPPKTIASIGGLSPYSAEVTQLERHLALVFHRFLEGKAVGRSPLSIRINGNAIAANNPVSHPLVSSYDAKTIRIPESEGSVIIRPYLLPSEDEVGDYHKGDREAASRALDRLGLYGKRNETQGLFIYRHDRLIKWGGWHQMWETNDEKTKLARVVVDFDSSLDDLFSVNISKQSVQLPQHLQVEIKKLAVAPRKASQQKYRRNPQTQTQRVASQPTQDSRSGDLPPFLVDGAQNVAAAQNNEPPSQATAIPAILPRSIVIRDVFTDKFVWKFSETLAGRRELQVSGVSVHLAALAKQIRSDASATGLLAAFLDQLDGIGAQAKMIASNDKP